MSEKRTLPPCTDWVPAPGTWHCDNCGWRADLHEGTGAFGDRIREHIAAVEARP